MPNSYFKFKQFTIYQDKCAMKVSTDACILGAWAKVNTSSSVLDIGAGTGLLSLMLAQRFPDIYIHAIEIDPQAAVQATDNIAKSDWKSRIQLIEGNVKEYDAGKYDHIICNPPFFSNSLLGPDGNRNTARHDLSLTQKDLIIAFGKLLVEEGWATVIFPATEHEKWADLLKRSGYYIHEQLYVLPRAGSKHNRVISTCSRVERPLIENTLAIKGLDNVYTPEFTQLMKPYYLNLQ